MPLDLRRDTSHRLQDLTIKGAFEATLHTSPTLFTYIIIHHYQMTQLVRKKHQHSSASKLDMHLDTLPIVTPTDAYKANESITQPGEIQLGNTDVHGEQNPLDHITLMMGDSDSESDSDSDSAFQADSPSLIEYLQIQEAQGQMGGVHQRNQELFGVVEGNNEVL
jgi:hypothetical protein